MLLFLASVITDIAPRPPAPGRLRRAPPTSQPMSRPHEPHARADPRVRQLHLRQPQLGPLPAAPRRRRHLDVLQVRHDLDAEHRAPARVSRRRRAAGVGGLALARPAEPRHRRRRSPALEAQRTGASSRATCRSTRLPYYPEVRYIVVVRDPRDVFMSFWNHYSAMTDAYFADMNAGPLHRPAAAALPGRHPRPLAALDQPRLVPLGERGLAALRQPLSHRLLVALPPPRNILFVHFADLLADLPEEIGRRRRLSRHRRSRRGGREALAAAVSFDALRRECRRRRRRCRRSGADFIWKDGLDTFFSRGTNGRWREVLTPGADALRGGQGALPDAGLRRLSRGRPRRLVRPAPRAGRRRPRAPRRRSRA